MDSAYNVKTNVEVVTVGNQGILSDF